MISEGDQTATFTNPLSEYQESSRNLLKQTRQRFEAACKELSQQLKSTRTDLVALLDQAHNESGSYFGFPSVAFVMNSILQKKKLFIGRSCPSNRAVGYASLILAAMQAKGDKRGVTLIGLQDMVQEQARKKIPGLSFVAYHNQAKADPNSVIIVHCLNQALLDVTSSILQSGVSPHLVIGSEEAYNALAPAYPSIHSYMLCKTNTSSLLLDCYERHTQLDDKLKGCLEDGLSDLLVFCEPDKMKEVMSMAHQHRRHAINCLEVQHRVDQLTYQANKRNVFIAENASTFRKAVGSSAKLEVRIIFDYNCERSTKFDLRIEVYTQENGLTQTSEQLSERLALGEELGATRYTIASRKGVRCLRKSLNDNNVAVAVLRYGRTKVQKSIAALQIEQFKELLNSSVSYLERHNKSLNAELQLNVPMEVWDSLPSQLFPNELLMIASHSKPNESPGVLNSYYLLFAYLRNTIGRPMQKKSRLNDLKGDLNMFRLLVSQYQTFDNFLKQELNRSKRKTSEGSVELERGGSLLKQQSSFQGEGKQHSSAVKAGRFSPYFVMKWADAFESLRGDSQVVLTPNESLKVEMLCSRRPVSFSKPLNKYILDNATKEGYYLGKHSLLSNIFPQLKHLQVLKLLKSSDDDRSGEILMAEECDSELLPNNEDILEFNQITTSILSQAIVRNFEESHNCEIELNPEFQSLIICCKKETHEQVETEFRKILQQLLSTVKNELIPRSYGVKTLQFSAGGRIAVITNPTAATSNSLVAIRNLPSQWTEADVLELLEEEGSIQSVAMYRNRQDERLKDAVIEFTKSDDAIEVYKLYDGAEVCGNVLRVCKPSDIKNPYMKEHKQVVLKWYTHKCDRVGQVLFETEEACRRAIDELRQYVNQQLTAPAEGLLVLKNLEEWVDEEYLGQLYGQLGPIVKISLKKIALPEKDNSQLLYYHLNEALGAGYRFIVSEIRTVDREIGEKQVTVTLDDLESVEKVSNYFNSKRDLLGKARTYAKKDAQCTYLGNESLMKLMKRLIEEFLRQKNIKEGEVSLKLDNFEDEFYLTVGSSNIALFRLVTSKIDELRRGQSIKPDSQGLVFTDLGKKRITELKQKFTCQITVQNASKTLSVICNSSDLDAIRKEIEMIPKHLTSIEYRLTRKMFDAMISNPEYLKQLSELVNAELNLENLSLELSGEIGELSRAKRFITDLGKDINKQLVSEETGICDICMEAFDSIPIKLMGCGHVFCKNCLSNVLDNCLSNYSDFPVKCPTCNDLMAYRDIEFLADGPERYNKLRKMAVNDYIASNSDKMCYCLTVGCDGIGFISTAKTVCDMCNKEYCLACKKPFHHGLTCWEASVGSEALFKMYISANDVRKCPNKKCPALIQKNGGCNKVFCAMCKMSICWKCMKHYNEQQEAYNHLNAVHGGYFDN